MLFAALHRSHSRSLFRLSSMLTTNRCLSKSTFSGVFNQVGFIGAGKMAEAMIAPMVHSGTLQLCCDIDKRISSYFCKQVCNPPRKSVCTMCRLLL